MEAYQNFAKVYDELMDNVPYDEWGSMIIDKINKYGITKPNRNTQDLLESEKNLIVDLGCGTGTLSQLLYHSGYDMIGIDYSEEMLQIAREKCVAENQEILYLCQDMREFELYSTVGTILCICDSINYLLSAKEVKQTFQLVENYLHPGGLFIFDFNTIYKYCEVIGDTVIA